tara:strand:+ start:331 stop:777 length:447 start_codon:yes stop_codon:yes gene_type:complete
MAKELTKNGRPSKYKKEYAKQAEKICLLGATDEFLANYFEVDVSTISNWKNAHSDFLEAIKRGKHEADQKVAESLFGRAVGYSHMEEKVFNNQGEILTHNTTKHYAPDPTAAIFWLKNRQPNQWRDKTETKVTMSDDFDALLGESLDD